MKKEILISILEHKNQLIEDSNHIYKDFKMETPTHIKFLLTPGLYEKMKATQKILEEYKLSEIKFSSLSVEEDSFSKLTLLLDNKIIKPQFYDYYEEKLPVFEPRRFDITCSNSTDKKFSIQFSYMNHWIEYAFKTESFNV